MRTAIKPLLLITLLPLSFNVAIAETLATDSLPTALIEQEKLMWGGVPYPTNTGMPSYYVPYNMNFASDPLLMQPMDNNQPMWPRMMPYFNVTPDGVNPNVASPQAVAPNTFAPLNAGASAETPIMQPSMYAPYYVMPMQTPDTTTVPMVNQFMGNSNKASDTNSELLQILKQTINGNINTMTSVTADRDRLKERIMVLEATITALKENVASMQGENKSTLTYKNKLLNKSKQTIQGNISAMQLFADSSEKKNKQFVDLKDQMSQQQIFYNQTSTQVTADNDIVLASKNQLLGKAKMTIEDNISVISRFTAISEHQSKQLLNLDSQINQQQALFSKSGFDNEAIISKKSALLGKAKETILGNIAVMHRFSGERDQLTANITDLKTQIATKIEDHNGLQVKFQDKIQAFSGLSDQLAGATGDDDQDKVVNLSDKCPNTPEGTYVNAQGCSADMDKDGITDDLDKCAFTKTGIPVNEKGCEKDTDNDGILDSKDQCAGSTEGVSVLETGCEEDTDKDGIFNSKDQCPESPEGVTVEDKGCEIDTDKDSISDSKDQCADTPKGIKVDDKGCELDTDKDSIVDSKDQCADTAKGIKVNEKGCEVDTDKDGIVDSKDQCVNTAEGIKIGEKGCEIDTDKDGVADSKDQCTATPESAKIDEKGCELDSDKDGIVDSKDTCADTPEGAKIDKKGCQLDADKDGIVDSKDACSDTPEGTKVDEKGCTLDADKDGIVDSQDKCPASVNDAKVDKKGCEIDSDKDGLVDSKDQCPNSPTGSNIDNKTGCAPDADKDGISDAKDLCPSTASGATVNTVGCSEDENITLKGVNFKTSSAQLTTASLPILDDAANMLKRHPDIRIEVGGHTDSVGGATTNKSLSQKRATTVMGYLVRKGINSSKITAKGYGEEAPVADNESKEGRASNRRVELKIAK
jgi:outer membrane protein OmpA-like peptidoglycan-associated protein/regulator of replication initiation timing